jgi:DNA polymerase III epsilon subunit-like protein
MDENQKIIFFDEETTCLNLLTDNKLWNLGWIVVQNNKILEQHNYYLKWPNFQLSPRIAAMTHFNRELYEKESKDPKEVLDLFEKYLYNKEYIISGFNILNFDIYVLNQLQKLIYNKTDYSYIDRSLDVHAVYKSILFGIPFNKKTDNFIAFQFKLCNTIRKGIKSGIDAAVKNLQIPVNELDRHGAIGDCLITNQIWNKIKYKIDI